MTFYARIQANVARLTVAAAMWTSLFSNSAAEKITAAQTYREAYDLGYWDGRQSGMDDYQEQRLFDLENHKEFQVADHGYEETRHEQEVFLIAYRRGFEDGYEEGYGLKPDVSDRDVRAPPESPPEPVGEVPRGSISRSAEDSSILITGTEFEVELLDTLSTKFNEKGDTFRARFFRDVRFRRGVIIPEGTQLHGRISHLKRAGRIRGRAQMSLRFEELRLLDGRTIPLEATLIGIDQRVSEKLKNGEGTIEEGSSKGKDMGKIAKTSAVGALIGVVTGGKRGGGVGALGGAAVGLGRVLLTRGKDAQIKTRTRLRLRLIEDLNLQ